MTAFSRRSALCLLSAALILPITLNAQQPPTDVTASDIRGSVTISWTGLRNQVGYRVLRASDQRSRGQDLTRPLGQGVTSFVDAGARPGTTYFYQVIAVYDDGTEGASLPIQYPAPGTAAPGPVPLGPVAGRLAPMPGPTVSVTGTPAAATVVWQQATGMTSYTVYRKENGVQVQRAQLPAHITSWLDVGLRPATAYSYIVNATYTNGAQGWTEVPFTTLAAVNPTSVTATAIGVGEVRLKWQPVSGASYYMVFGPGPSSGVGKVRAGGSNNLIYDVTGVPGGLQTWAVGSHYDPDPITTAPGPGPNAVSTPGTQFTKAQLLVAAAPVITARRTNFDPLKNGFQFVNDFKNSFIGPPVNWQTSGLCGGMSYAVLDYYYAGIPTPNQAYRPANNTPIQQYLYGRQVTSLTDNLDKWGEISFNPGGARNVEFFHWGLGPRLQELKAFIDRGVPVPLGLKGVGIGHQVVAVGYDVGRYMGDIVNYTNIGDLKIFIFDPNHPRAIMTMVADIAAKNFYYLEDTYERWGTYFVDGKYRKAPPPNIVYPQYPNNGLVYELRFGFTTGDDDMRGGADHVDVTVTLTNGTSQLYPNVSRNGRWVTQFIETAQVFLNQPVQVGMIKSVTITTNSGGMNADNWNMNVLRVSAVGGGFDRDLLTTPAGPHIFTAARIPLVVPIK